MSNKPVYRLRELMYKKYGENKFALGCELIARWVNFEIRDIPTSKIKRWCADYVNQLCNTTRYTNLVNEEAEALRQIFGLKSVNELYTNQQ